MKRLPERYNQLTQTRYGTIIYNKNDVLVGRSVELYGEYCERAIVVFDQIVGAGKIVVDIGANIGMHSLFLARKVGPEGCVLSFEPQRVLFQTLCGNMALNSITNVHCWNAAVGEKHGEIAVPRVDYERSADFSAMELGTATVGERVPLIALDSLNLPRCDFIRIASPGMELAILEGANSLLRRLKPILYIGCELDPQRELELIARLRSLGYSMHWHAADLFNAENFASNTENVFGGRALRSLLCVDVTVEQQLTGFTKVDVADAA